MKNFSLKGKKCIVTGAGRGIGYAIANHMSELGAHVIGLDLIFSDQINYNFKKELVDLSKKNNIIDFSNRFESKNNLLDVLVNCAGITITNEGDYDLKDWEKTISVNLTAPFLITKSLKKSLIATSGSVINISSLNGKLAFPGNPAYIASKTGLDGLTRSYALEYGKYNVRVNSIAPGYIKTDMTGESWSNIEKRKKRKNRTMLNRWGTTQELLGPVVFLASEASSYITGQTIYVDGGWSSKGF